MGAIIVFVFYAICMSLICRKMGYPAIVGAMVIIPVLGWLLLLGLVWYMAYASWPNWPEEN